jgi:predicted metal-binding protein
MNGYRPRPLEEYCRRALERGASRARVVPASYVVTAPWVRYKCRFGCGSYGTRHLCPPATPKPAETEAVVRCYDRAIFVTYEAAGSSKQRPLRKKMHKDMLELEREIFLDGYYKALAFVAGPCNLCKTCDVSKPCKLPGEPRPAMEACGIDVFATFANAGVKLDVVRSESDPYKLCGMILVE